MRCSVCGHESPPGSSFCLNCGSALAQTPVAGSGLPVICSVCRGENPIGMKFCRSCGTSLGQTTPGSPAMAGGAPMMGAPLGGAPMMQPPPMAQPMSAPAIAPPPVVVPAPRPSANAMITCPRCGTSTPVGFAYCQQCGLHMQGIAPTDPGGTGARPRTPSASPPPAQLVAVAGGIDPHAGTLAQPDQPRAVAPMRPSAPAPGPAAGQWGSAVLVNRDGSDGQRFALVSDDTVLGRNGADIAFDDDRFLARQHARIERADGVVRVHPLDTLNGVFRKADAPVELVDGATFLVGREVLRFERVSAEERTVHPLIRHGVALFGSPPREPWGRVLQIIPSGGHRDVWHLFGEEIVLGREDGDIVYRDDAFMSRRHAALNWNGKTCQLTDLGSSNGTFVRIQAATALKHGDHIRLGDQLLRIELR